MKVRGSALRYIAKSGLWRAVALAWPREFLQGLFDEDGGVGVWASPKRFQVAVTLTNSNLDVLGLARRLLVDLGIKCPWPPRRKHRKGEVARIRGGRYRLRRDCWEVRVREERPLLRFASLVNFRVERRRKLEDALRILKRCRSNRERVMEWLRMYRKPPTAGGTPDCPAWLRVSPSDTELLSIK